MRLVTLGSLIALALPLAASSQPALDAFDVCAQEQDGARRLTCFDRQIAARRTTAAAAATALASAAPLAAPPPTPKPLPARGAESDVGLTARMLNKLHPERAEAGKPARASIDGKVARVIPRRPLISAFELDNGQVWEQNESLDGLRIRPEDTVTISEGPMGGFLLKTSRGETLRVHRVR